VRREDDSPRRLGSARGGSWIPVSYPSGMEVALASQNQSSLFSHGPN
jgi:hypothetical protein